MLSTHRARKGPGGWRLGLRLNAAGGVQECLWPLRSEDQVQDPSRLTGPKWAGEILGPFTPILWSQRAPPLWPLFFSPPPTPSDAQGATWPVGAWKVGDQTQKPNRIARAEWVGETPAAPPLIFQSRRAPPCLPLLLFPAPPSLPPIGPMRLEGALENGGPGPGAQQASQGWVGRGNTRSASPDPLIPEGPARHLSSSPATSLLLP